MKKLNSKAMFTAEFHQTSTCRSEWLRPKFRFLLIPYHTHIYKYLCEYQKHNIKAYITNAKMLNV